MVLERAYPFPESDRVFSASPRAHSQIIAFFGLLKYFQTCILTFCILYVFSLFSFTEKKYHDVISFHVFARWNFIARGLYIIFILKIEKEIYILKIKV